MADNVKVLAESSAVATGATTVGTVPAGKTWVFKIMQLLQAGGGGATVVAIAVNGCTILSKSVSASNYMWTSTAAQQKTGASLPDGSALADCVAPGPGTYYGNAGDTIVMTLTTTNATANNIQLVGTEVDVA